MLRGSDRSSEILPRRAPARPGQTSGTRSIRRPWTPTASSSTSSSARSGCAGEPGSRRVRHAARLLGVDHLERMTEAVAALLLDLDHEQPTTSTQDEIELVAARARVGVEQAVAAKPVVTEGAAARRDSRCLVAARLEGPAMKSRSAEDPDRPRVRRCDVADVRHEAVARVDRVEPAHHAIANDLRHDRGGCDRGASRIAVDERAMRRRSRPEPKAVDETCVRGRMEIGEDSSQRAEVRAV